MYKGDVTMFTESEYNDAKEAVIAAQKCTISFIQRKLRIGYNHAAYLVEALQNEGIISAPDYAGRMTVLVKCPVQEDCCCGETDESWRLCPLHKRPVQEVSGSE